MTDQSKQVASANLPIGGFQDSPQTSVIVMNRRLVEQVTQGFFKGIAHANLAKYVG